MNPLTDELPERVQVEVEEILQPVWLTGGLWLYASLADQRLFGVRGMNQGVFVHHISASRFGAGNLFDSECTPLGLHRICAKIGEGLSMGSILKGRIPTGKIAKPLTADDQKTADITSRILRINGLNAGFNSGINEQGLSVDSYQRYIYIHGTNRQYRKGQATSHGCITLADRAMIQLYDMVQNHMLVLICHASGLGRFRSAAQTTNNIGLAVRAGSAN